jgi:hypothetical protein
MELNVLEKLDAKVKALELALGQAVSKITLDNSLTVEAASAVLKFAQNQISFAGGTFDCGGGAVTPGAPDLVGGPFLNSAAQKCFYCGAPHGAVSFQVQAASA